MRFHQIFVDYDVPNIIITRVSLGFNEPVVGECGIWCPTIRFFFYYFICVLLFEAKINLGVLLSLIGLHLS